MYKVKSMKSIAETLNDVTYTDYYFRLKLLAQSIFKWEGLPPMMNEMWIEKYLFSDGKCMFFDDPNLGFIVTKCNTDGELNNYDEPSMLIPHATNCVWSKPLEIGKECVLIRNNDVCMPTDTTTSLFALRLAEVTRTADININAMKTPVIILGSERQKFSLVNLFKKWNGYEPVIYGDKNMEHDMMKALKIDAPVVFDKLRIEKHEIWNEAMTFYGINNANQNKRERLVADEVEANNEQVDYSAHIMLKSRERACEEINNLFGLNLSVKMRSADELKEVMSDVLEV